jgi:hypothetical protein
MNEFKNSGRYIMKKIILNLKYSQPNLYFMETAVESRDLTFEESHPMGEKRNGKRAWSLVMLMASKPKHFP